jgi:hypothetical protein
MEWQDIKLMRTEIIMNLLDCSLDTAKGWKSGRQLPTKWQQKIYVEWTAREIERINAQYPIRGLSSQIADADYKPQIVLAIPHDKTAMPFSPDGDWEGHRDRNLILGDECAKLGMNVSFFPFDKEDYQKWLVETGNVHRTDTLTEWATYKETQKHK